MRYEVLKLVISKFTVSRDVFRGREVNDVSVSFGTLIFRAESYPKMEGECSEISLHIYQTTRRHTQQDNHPHKCTLWIK